MNVWSRPRRKALEEVPDDMEFWSGLRVEVLALITPLFREMFAAGALMGAHRRAVKAETLTELLEGEFGDTLPELVFDAALINQVGELFIENYANQWWDALERSTRAKLRRAIEQARAEGLGVQAVADAIAADFGAARALRIATSELTNLLGAGQQSTYAQAGFAFWVWETVKDARVDPICDELQGEQFPMSTLFEKAHVGCRCYPRPAGEVTDMVQPLGFPTPLGTFMGRN